MTLELPEDIGHEPGPLLQDTAACVWTDLLVSLFFFWCSQPYQPACLCGLGWSNGCRIDVKLLPLHGNLNLIVKNDKSSFIYLQYPY